MASFIDAAAIVGFGITIILFQAALGLDEVQIGVASGALTLGVAVGALLGGRLGDRFGRRPVFTVTMIVVIAALVALMMAPSFPVLAVGAVLLGLATGADLPVSLSTISEAATDANRGRLLGFSNLLWLAGAVTASLLGSAVATQGQTGIRIVFGSLAAITALVLLARLTIPESETWKRAQIERTAGGRAGPAAGRVRELFCAPYAAPFFALIGFYTLTNLVANTTGQYGNYVLVNIGGVPLQTAAIIGLPVLPLSILAALWFMKIADKRSRFRYFTIGAVFQVLSPLSFAVFGVSIPTYLASIVFTAIGTAFAFEGIMKVWAQKSFPTLLRTTAQGAIISVARFVAALFAGVTPVLLSAGPSALYGILAALAMVGCAWAWIVFRTRDSIDEFARDSDSEETSVEESRPLLNS
ncbi:MFS transporter [Rathayibacter festucae]|uniref:MFS transporter n=1 Tax=Rathayibacter festucae TaxID=110937 RepID=UPI002A6B6479|nr:MFS transporter [Rathayibacter festucae]MDY0914550.1 MFS transporter [Rathayibacter festucae]